MSIRSSYALRPLIKIGWRSIRKAPLRSLLVFGLVAFVVGAGTFAAIANRSTGSSVADLQLVEFGSGNFRAEFATMAGAAGGYGPFPVPIQIPAPIVGSSDLAVPAQPVQNDELDERRIADRDWLAGFDVAAAEAEIERALATDVSLERKGYSTQFDGPFGSRGSVVDVISDLDVSHPVAAGAVTVIEGRVPTAADEIAIYFRDRPGHPVVGDVITLRSQELTIVGIITSPANRHDSIALVTPETFDRIVDPENGLSFAIRADLADGLAPEQAADMVASIVDYPIAARTPTVILNAEATGGWTRYAYDANAGYPGLAVPRVWPILISGLLAIQIALVCAAAFAVGVRRRTKEFGQLMALGADDRHIRRLAQVEAALLGVLAAVVGLVIGVVAGYVFVSNGWLDTAGNRVPTGVRWSIFDWLGPAAVGIVAVVIAAWWPTRVLTNAPIPGVLEGRLPSVPVRKTTPRWGLVLIAAGAVFLALGAEYMISGSGQSGGAFLLLLLGITTMVAGSILLIGTILSALGRFADRLPLLARLTVRTSDRQRARSWVVVGAFIAALAVPVLIGASIEAYPNSYQGRETSEFEARLLTTIQVTYDPSAGTDEVLRSQLSEFDDEFGQQISDTNQVTGEVDYLVAPDAQILWTDGSGSYWSGGRIVAATSELINLLDLSDEIVEQLAAGNAVEVSTYRNQQSGEPTLSFQSSPPEQGVPIEVIDGPSLFPQDGWLMSEAALAERGATVVSLGTVRLFETPLNQADEEAVRQLGNELWAARFGEFATPYEADNEIVPWMDLQLNRTYQNGVSANTVRLWSTVIATALALLVALVTSALTAVEMTTEIESMIATGASPSIRRRLLGAQSLYHLLVAAAIAIPLALLVFWTVSRADDYGPINSRDLTVPWFSIGIAAVFIPLAVAVTIAAIFRNGKPAISRRLS